MIDNINYKELKKANGDVFLEVNRLADHNIICLNWIGIQSLETIVMGGNFVLSMLRQEPSKGLLNSNREIIGPWESAVNWMAFKWAPQARALGLQYFAHVLSPGIYGQRSYQALYPHLKEILEVKSFEDEKEAAKWLRTITTF